MNKKLLFLASAASVVALAACNASVTDTTDMDDESYSSMSDDMMIDGDDSMMLDDSSSSSVDAMDASSVSSEASSVSSL